MAQSNHERVGKALDLLKAGLFPFIEREMRSIHGEKWEEAAMAGFRDDRGPPKKKGGAKQWDTHALLSILWDQWNTVFKKTLGHAERSLVSELRDARNRWAHQEPFTTDDAYRALDSIGRLLTAVSAPEAVEVDRQKKDLLRVRFEEEERRETKKASVAPVEGQPASGLKPWREIVTPHPDVTAGRYRQAEFAADLDQVHRGEGEPEYRDPTEFFRRTFLTEGLRQLLTGALLRLSEKGGDPVVELQTNFGGGKTHSMLALYHMFSGTPAGDLPGLERVLDDAKMKTLPQANRAVLVGTALGPAQARKKPDGTLIHTLWGELAWQLLGKEGYKLLADADRRGVSPGSDILRTIFQKAAPSLVLIDEWVAYVRLIHGKTELPGGSFESNLTFAQSLTEAAKAVKGTLLVASLPASDIEVGGDAGREALAHLKNVFKRVQTPWRPASAEESFEIVRRRLFEPISDPKLYAARDAVAQAFSELYRRQPQEFPSACREADYLRRIKAAYPIHPELFDHLYNEWSSREKFQRTRGVLRLMAGVIHALWERQDGGLLILPAMVPLDSAKVQTELVQHLEEHWVPIIEKDVDGPHSLPLRLDGENPNLGRYSACRRVARTIFMGTAPTFRDPNRGIEDAQVKLGCVQPGESVATFGDALRRLTDHATHLYVDDRRFWYSTQPTVTRLAQDRAEQLSRDKVEEEIQRRLFEEQKSRGDFARVHACPASSAVIPDEREARLVILGPQHPHSSKEEGSPARKEAGKILEERGAAPRRYRNTLVFLAADRKRLVELETGVRQYLAWKSIEDERASLNLDVFQTKLAESKRKHAEEAVEQRVLETYHWLLVPEQPRPMEPVGWQEARLQGQDALALRASRKLKSDGLLMTQLAGTLLRGELDKIPLWRGDHVGLKQLEEDFAQYIYLQRLRNAEVLLGAVRDGVAQLSWEKDTFAYADGYDAAEKRYKSLRAGQSTNVTLEGEAVIVKPQAAQRQMAAEKPAPGAAGGAGEPARAAGAGGSAADGGSLARHPPGSGGLPGTRPEAVRRRFYGTVSLDPQRVGRDAGRIAEEVIQHLTSLLKSKVEVILEIRAEIPGGIPDNVIRTVGENCRTLKFKGQGFEEE